MLLDIEQIKQEAKAEVHSVLNSHLNSNKTDILTFIDSLPEEDKEKPEIQEMINKINESELPENIPTLEGIIYAVIEKMGNKINTELTRINNKLEELEQRIVELET